MVKFGTDGLMLPADPVTDEEMSNTLAYAKLVVPNTEDGAALSQLRLPGSTVSLARVEAIASALVKSGKMVRVVKQTGKGTFHLYKLGAE